MTLSTTTVYAVAGMTCQGCAVAVSRAILRAAPSAEVTVDLAGGLVVVEHAASNAAVRQAIIEAGYGLLDTAL